MKFEIFSFNIIIIIIYFILFLFLKFIIGLIIIVIKFNLYYKNKIEVKAILLLYQKFYLEDLIIFFNYSGVMKSIEFIYFSSKMNKFQLDK